LLHLDLKPSNILLDCEDNAPWDQVTPRVSDFGLALWTGKLDDARRIADRRHDFACLLISMHPDQPAAHLASSLAFEQFAKNAGQVNSRPEPYHRRPALWIMSPVGVAVAAARTRGTLRIAESTVDQNRV
jgi:serine/threonine protein kinase